MELGSLTIDGVRAASCSSVRDDGYGLAELHYVAGSRRRKGINSFLALSRERALAQAAKIDTAGGEG